MPRPLAFLSAVTLGCAFVVAACSADEPSQRLRRGASRSAQGGSSTAPADSDTETPDGKPGAPLNGAQQGIATFYDADGTGNCSFPASKNLMVVAPHKERHYDGSAACGACMRVTGRRGSVVVRVVDSCPVDTGENDCGDTGADLDLSAQAFAAIEDPDVGITKVTFEVVPCEVAGPMQFRFKAGSSRWWTAVQVRNHREPIAKVEYFKDGAWIKMTREDDNYFVEPDGVGPRPQGLALRITAQTGQIVEETLPLDDRTTLTGEHQFD